MRYPLPLPQNLPLSLAASTSHTPPYVLLPPHDAPHLPPPALTCLQQIHLAVLHPGKALGQNFHLQNSQDPLPLGTLLDLVRACKGGKGGDGDGGEGVVIESVSLKEFQASLNAAVTRELAAPDSDGQATVLQRLQAGLPSFEKYLAGGKALRFGSTALHGVLGGTDIRCPAMDATLIETYVAKLL